MDEKNYLKERVDGQIAWYDKKSMWNQKLYKRLRILEIVVAAFIPFLTGYFSDELSFIKIVVGGMGVLIAVIAGVVSLYNFQEHWIEYRTTAETLKHERFLFITKTPPYNSDDPFPIFVSRVESLISTENSKWPQRIQAIDKKNRKKEEE